MHQGVWLFKTSWNWYAVHWSVNYFFSKYVLIVCKMTPRAGRKEEEGRRLVLTRQGECARKHGQFCVRMLAPNGYYCFVIKTYFFLHPRLFPKQTHGIYLIQYLLCRLCSVYTRKAAICPKTDVLFKSESQAPGSKNRWPYYWV
jgi:hypothetical protein